MYELYVTFVMFASSISPPSSRYCTREKWTRSFPVRHASLFALVSDVVYTMLV